uniref:Uncharacterized protein n=2 Tax=Pseudomonas phage PaBG TaxID=1335230 RepID=S5WBB7_9CAUD
MLMVAPDEKLPKRRPKGIDYVIMFSVKDMRRNLDAHQSFEPVVFLVFDTPIALSGYTIQHMDFKIGSDVHIDGFECIPLNLNLSIDSKPFERSGLDIVQLSIEEVKAQRTLLNQLMTFIYSLPRATHQRPINSAVCSWMGSKTTLVKLNNDLAKMRDSPLTAKQLARLNDILSSETAVLYREAMREGGDSEVLARRYGISAYEINYMRAIAARS